MSNMMVKTLNRMRHQPAWLSLRVTAEAQSFVWLQTMRQCNMTCSPAQKLPGICQLAP